MTKAPTPYRINAGLSTGLAGLGCLWRAASGPLADNSSFGGAAAFGFVGERLHHWSPKSNTPFVILERPIST